MRPATKSSTANASVACNKWPAADVLPGLGVTGGGGADDDIKSSYPGDRLEVARRAFEMDLIKAAGAKKEKKKKKLLGDKFAHGALVARMRRAT